MAWDITEQAERAFGASSTRRFEGSADLIREVERALAGHGVAIQPGSAFERGCLVYQDFQDRFADGFDRTLDEAHRLELGSAISAWEVAERIVRLRSRGVDLSGLVPHLRLLGDARHPIAERGTGDDATNKLTELLVGLACMRFCDRVELDHPDASNGDNPDVLLRWLGRWRGIACKVPNGLSAETAVERLVEGIRQVRASRASMGLVLLGVRNWIPHDETFVKGGLGRPGSRSYRSVAEATEAINERLAERARLIKEAGGSQLMDEFRRDRRVVPALIQLAQTIVQLDFQGAPILTRLVYLHVDGLGLLSYEEHCFMQQVNTALSYMGFEWRPTVAAP